jgi:hypothetical protein
MGGEAGQLIIDLTAEGRDTLAGGGHGLLHAWQDCTLGTSVEERPAHGYKADKSYYVNWFVRD